jgi:hypothetical protein
MLPIVLINFSNCILITLKFICSFLFDYLKSARYKVYLSIFVDLNAQKCIIQNILVCEKIAELPKLPFAYTPRYNEAVCLTCSCTLGVGSEWFHSHPDTLCL